MGRQEASPHGTDRAELGRLELFSDAVFAIAITLLVLELKVPEPDAVRAAGGLGAALLGEIPRFATYFISFVVIGNYWMLHHLMFHRLRRCDEALVAVNLVLLLFVAFLPFPVALFGSWRRDPVAIGWYATCVILTGLSLNLVWWYAAGKGRLVAPDLDRRVASYVQFRLATVPIVFALTVPFSFLHPTWTMFSMIAAVPLLRIFGTRFERAAREAEHQSRAAVPAAPPAAVLAARLPAPSPAGPPREAGPPAADPTPGP